MWSDLVLKPLLAALSFTFSFQPEQHGLQEPFMLENSSSSATFVHPGVFVSKGQLDFVRAQVKAGNDPWSEALDSLLNHSLASLYRNPTPFAAVECGPTSQNPGNGCHEEREDALAAYAMALAWYITSDDTYAKKSISYMNAWSKTIKSHTYDNALLQTGWSGASWARAAEIIRHTYDGWAASDITRFQTMLRNVYLPLLVNGSDRTGNWDLVITEAAVGIAVFLDDRTVYNKAMTRFKGRVPAFIYLTKDGSYPKAAPGSPQDTANNKDKIIGFWYNQPTFPVNGIAQETCRDFVHTGYGLASISHIAETSWIQGEDLYATDIGTRLRHGLGFHSQYQLGAAKPSWLCPGNTLTRNMEAVTEPGFNALNERLGNAMANTEQLTYNNRPAGTNWLFIGWETLTHGENPAT